MKYCTKCGHQMADDMMFCQKCGTKVENAVQPVQETPKQAAPQYAPQHTPQYTQQPAVTPKQKPRRVLKGISIFLYSVILLPSGRASKSSRSASTPETGFAALSLFSS